MNAGYPTARRGRRTIGVSRRLLAARRAPFTLIGLARSLPPLTLFLVLARSTGQSAAEPETLQAVLARAAAYVVTFEQRLSGIVAEETSVRDAYNSAIHRAGMREVPHTQHRDLRSDLLLVRPAGAEGGSSSGMSSTSTADRTDRLARLFLQPPNRLPTRSE
jgi:hypothetical protein